MDNRWFNKLWVSSKQWFLGVVWSRVRTHKELSLIFLILAVVILVCIMLWSCMVKHAQLTAGFLTSLVLAIGLYFGHKQLKLMKATEQAKLINNMSIYWDSKIMRQARKAVAEIPATSTLNDEIENSRKAKDFEKYVKLLRVGNFFEELGNLARQETIDLPLIAGRFRTEILNRYDDYERFIMKRRKHRAKKLKQPTVYEHFEWLAKEIKKIKI